MEKEEEVVEAINSNEDEESKEEIIDEEEESFEEDIDALKNRLKVLEEDNKKLEDAKRQLTARSKKAEALSKNINKTESNPNALDERILVSQGMDSELLDELKVLAQARGKTLLETQNDPIFIAIKAQKEVERNAEKARLGASRASGSGKEKKTFNTKGIPDNEHKQMWKDAQGI